MRQKLLLLALFTFISTAYSFGLSNLYGRTSVCTGSTAKYTLLVIGEDVTWSVNGNAEIIFGLQTNQITVKFYGSGTVRIKAKTQFEEEEITVSVIRRPTVSIRMLPFNISPLKFQDKNMTFVADVTPSSSGTYHWSCGSNPISDPNNRITTITMNNHELVRCSFTNSCGTASDEVDPRHMLQPFKKR